MGTLIADIGNTHIHIYDGLSVEHLPHLEAIAKYKEYYLVYICVKSSLLETLIGIKNWQNISAFLKIEGEYKTMGIDRKALCLSRDDGVFIDAGSAITVDVVKDGIYRGGFILAGIQATLKSYRDISPALDSKLNKQVNLNTLPKSTQDGISYGIIASIKAIIEQHIDNEVCYFTGGDGLFLSQFFENAIYDETLIFEGIQKVIKETKLCKI